MHEALLLIARAIALAHEHWRRRVGRRRPLSGKIGVLEERAQRLEAENGCSARGSSGSYRADAPTIDHTSASRSSGTPPAIAYPSRPLPVPSA